MNQKALIIQQKMEFEDEFLKKCVILLFGQQEADERAAKTTHHDNGMGFNKADANFLSEWAVAFKSWDCWKPSIAEPSLPDIRKRMAKYAGQLARLIPDHEILPANAR